MGEMRVVGRAFRDVSYDRMLITLKLHKEGDTSNRVSEDIAKSCEEFLSLLKDRGVNTDNITFAKDDISECEKRDLRRGEWEYKNYFRACRILQIDCEFNMDLVNLLHTTISSCDFNIEMETMTYISNEREIHEEMYLEALKNARRSADKMAELLGVKLVSLLKSDQDYVDFDDIPRNEKTPESFGQVLMMTPPKSESVYNETSNLIPQTIAFTKEVKTLWEVQCEQRTI